MRNLSSIEKEQDGHYVLRGLVDADSACYLMGQGSDIIEQGPKRLEFDLSELEPDGSPVIALLLSWLKHARKNNRELLFKNPEKRLMLIAKASGVDAILNLG